MCGSVWEVCAGDCLVLVLGVCKVVYLDEDEDGVSGENCSLSVQTTSPSTLNSESHSIIDVGPNVPNSLRQCGNHGLPFDCY